MKGAALLLLLGISSCQTNKTMTTENNKNPLMCGPETGMCQMPGSAADNDADIDPVSKPVKIIYYTDPICSSC